MLAFHNGVPAGALAARLLANVAADTLKNGLSTWVSVSHVGIHTDFLAFHVNCGPILSILFGERKSCLFLSRHSDFQSNS